MPRAQREHPPARGMCQCNHQYERHDDTWACMVEWTGGHCKCTRYVPKSYSVEDAQLYGWDWEE